MLSLTIEKRCSATVVDRTRQGGREISIYLCVHVLPQHDEEVKRGVPQHVVRESRWTWTARYALWKLGAETPAYADWRDATRYIRKIRYVGSINRVKPSLLSLLFDFRPPMVCIVE